jgi:glycosyltransferase involved in cell wall biosynthesis
MSTRSRPKVSVCVITYNHAQFIAQALDSILAQKATFDFDVVIGDDCSTDGTTDILRTYQNRWPDKIKPLLRDRNVGMGKNFNQMLRACTGEYIAILEGDDYWTDSSKLQLQADYLDQNPECALCHHIVEHLAWPSETVIKEYPPARYRTERLPERELAIFNFVQTCSVMFRKEWLPALDQEFEELKLGDWPLFVLLGQKGWIGYIDRMMAHYRVHSSNSWNSRSAEYKLIAMEKMARYLLKRVNSCSREHWQDTLLALAFKDLLSSARSLALSASINKLRRFVAKSVEFRKPFWVFTTLKDYYAAHRV